MNAAILRLEEEIGCLTDNLASIRAGAEPNLSDYDRRALEGQIRRERAEIDVALGVLRHHRLMVGARASTANQHPARLLLATRTREMPQSADHESLTA